MHAVAVLLVTDLRLLVGGPGTLVGGPGTLEHMTPRCAASAAVAPSSLATVRESLCLSPALPVQAPDDGLACGACAWKDVLQRPFGAC